MKKVEQKSYGVQANILDSTVKTLTDLMTKESVPLLSIEFFPDSGRLTLNEELKRQVKDVQGFVDAIKEAVKGIQQEKRWGIYLKFAEVSDKERFFYNQNRD